MRRRRAKEYEERTKAQTTCFLLSLLCRTSNSEHTTAGLGLTSHCTLINSSGAEESSRQSSADPTEDIIICTVVAVALRSGRFCVAFLETGHLRIRFSFYMKLFENNDDDNNDRLRLS